MKGRLGCFAVVMGLAAFAIPVGAASIRGTAFPSAPPAGGPRPVATDVVVWLESVPERSEHELALGRRSWFLGRRRTPPKPRLAARHLQFQPRVLVLAVGDTLVIHNEDRVWHGSFSVSPAHEFDLGKLAPGHMERLTFREPGQVQVRCDIHPDMSMNLVVAPNHAFTRPDRAGQWRLPELPEGSYVLHAWAPGLRELRREVTLPRHGEVAVELRW